MKSELKIEDFTTTEEQASKYIRYNVLFQNSIHIEDYKTKAKDGYYKIGRIYYFNKDIVIFRLRLYCITLLLRREVIVLYKGVPIITTSRLSKIQLNYLYHFLTQ